jgi:hypothetical protein
MRRSVAGVLTWLSLVAMLVALLPSTVQATAPIRTRDRSLSLDCFIVNDDGFLYLTITESTAFGEFVDLAFWPADRDPGQDPPSYVLSDASVTATATSIDATLGLVEFDPANDPPFGDPLPPAILDATLSPLGDPFPIEDRFRDGNRFGRETGTFQALLVEGTLTLPGADLTDLSGCFAQSTQTTFFGSNPAAFVASFAEASVGCSWELETGFVDLFIGGDFGGLASIEVFGLVDGREIGGFNDATLTSTAFSGDVVLEAFEDGSIVGSAAAAGSLTQVGETIKTTERSGKAWVKAITTLYDVDGSLELDLDGTATSLPMDAEHCGAIDQSVREKRVRSAGPKPRPYPNETPATATRAVVGGKVIKLTTGAGAPEPEASCILDDEFDAPLGHTAWWSVVGNGREITVDTAGSDFDTVAAVYARSGGALVQIDCVDDNSDGSISDLQARVTWASQAGVTYLVQIGGFGGSTGHLQVRVR